MSVICEEGDFDVVASCCDGAECIQAIRNLSPDIALVNISMPSLSGLDILATATSEGLRTRVLFLIAAVEAYELVTAESGERTA
jgi:DNA-binding NarL/FixJ family response regulator